MAWSASKIFRPFVADVLDNTSNNLDINTDAMKAALFDNTITPNQDVTAANSAYAAGVWASGGVTDTGSSAPAGWPSVGRPLVTPTIDSATAATVFFDAVDTVSANAVTTLTNATGALIYDDTTTVTADQGVCFNWFGGPNTVTLGTFTIVWHANGIFRFTL